MNWDVAHRVASMAAVQAHRDLGVDRLQYVDVYAALRRAGVIGMARPMARLFGVYVSPQDNGPAVLLNENLDIIAQRHTAAHELGHHRLGHRSAYDQELDRATRWGDGTWPDEEKIAEAFAAWFLMPPAVRASSARPDRRTPPSVACARLSGGPLAGNLLCGHSASPLPAAHANP
ncbi:ImmA/IrrE family metallo-endopeptidase [Nonomuraea salmonea]|uniref:ImmA/IrrE family metallo-endopeptidase n=1 Tax=Nonomuraea salmonea TaxID=46181 RepID=UPI002FE9B6CC